MKGLIVRSHPDYKRPEVIEGFPLTVMFGDKQLKGWTAKPYAGEKAIVLHGRYEAKIVLDGLYQRDGKLHCRWVN